MSRYQSQHSTGNNSQLELITGALKTWITCKRLRTRRRAKRRVLRSTKIQLERPDPMQLYGRRSNCGSEVRAAAGHVREVARSVTAHQTVIAGSAHSKLEDTGQNRHVLCLRMPVH